MSNEKENNNIPWRDKLEDANSLPGEILQDKNTAWEKLYSRLEPKTKKRTTLLYWVLAACSLLMLAVFSLSTQNDHKEIRPLAAIKKDPLIIRSPVTKEQEINDLIVVAATSSAASRSLMMHAKKQQINIDTQALFIKSNVAMRLQPVELPKITGSPLPPEQAVQLTVSVPAKEIKKLKMVHINELGSPVQQPDDAHYASANPSHLNFSKQYVYSEQPGSSKHRALSITNKISPQN